MTLGARIAPNNYIRRIVVTKLFGRYDYVFGEERDRDPPLMMSPFLVLYGDNGSGKTTILRLLFHLLSPGRARGHKTYIGRVPFRAFEVELADATRIVCSRESNDHVGAFEIVVDGPSGYARAKWIVLEGKVPAEQVSTDQLRVDQLLKDLSIQVFFLGDNRVLKNDDVESSFYAERLQREMRQEARRIERGEIDVRDMALRESIFRADQWTRAQALQRSDVGERNIINVLGGVVDRISLSYSAPKPASTGDAVGRLRELALRSGEQARYGLTPKLELEELLSKAGAIRDEDKSTLLNTVMTSYAENLEARLDALQPLHDRLSLFERISAEFFVDKKLTINVRDGITMRSRGRLLDLDVLSSGEKHLLLLLCNTLASSDSGTLFIIDEPEISLNVKWQRQLLGALLGLTAENPVQFVFATHSIQLIADYPEHVHKLVVHDE